ncbi:MAG: hypothetical protein JKY65_06000 [Planctomycetes bacterium]|nr:hypothetical protein [Planctomycetota bacterium]
MNELHPLLAFPILLVLAGCTSPPPPVFASLALDSHDDGYALRMTDDQGGEFEVQVLLGPGCSFKAPAGGDLAMQPSGDTWRGRLLVESKLGGIQSLEVACFFGWLGLGDTGFGTELSGAEFDARPNLESPPVPVVVLPNGRVLQVNPSESPTLILEVWEGELISGESFAIHTFSSPADKRIEILPVLAGKPIQIGVGSARGWVKGGQDRSFVVVGPVALVKLRFELDKAIGTLDSEPVELQRTSRKEWTYSHADVAAVTSGGN